MSTATKLFGLILGFTPIAVLSQVPGSAMSSIPLSPAWGYALDFNGGSSQYAKVGGPVTTQTDNITLEAWVRWDGTTSASAQTIVSNGYSNSDGYGLYLNPSNNYLAILVSTVTWYEPTVTLTPDVWTHVALVRNGGTWALYKNGQSIPIGAPTANPITPSTNTFVGGDSVSNYFRGDIDEVRISTIARYTSNFTVSLTPFTSDGSTAALYHFDEGSGSTASDASGNGHTLALINSPVWDGRDDPVPDLVVTTGTATDIDASTAILHGSVNPYGQSTSVRFLYGTTSGVYIDSVDAVPSTVSGNSTTDVSGSLSGLAAATTYYYVTAATNSYGYLRGSEKNITTESPSWGHSLTFGGGSSTYAKAGGPATTQTDNITLEAWVRWDGTSSASAQLIVSNGYSGSDGYGLYLNPSNNYLAILVSAIAWYEPVVTLTPNVWTHVALVRNSGTWALFKNGESIPIGAPTANPITPSTNTFVGGDSVSNYFRGDIDEVRISTIARYTSDFTIPGAPFTADANTATLYHLDEGTGATSADSSGNGNDLSLVNSPVWDGSDNPAVLMVISTEAATDIDTSSVTVNGTVYPYGDTATVRFLYGTTSGVYTDSTDAVPSTVSGDSATTVSSSLTDLSPGTVYYYVLEAVSGLASARGTEKVFATKAVTWEYALDFNGASSQYAKSGGVATTQTDDVTIEAWVKWDGTNSIGTQMIVSNGYAGSDGYGVGLFPPHDEYTDFHLSILVSTVTWYESGVTLTPGLWTHVALVRNSGTWALYKNGQGVSIGTPSDDPLTPSTNTFVGGDSVGNYFYGDIDGVRISTVARYTSDFAVSLNPFGSDGTTAALYHFDEGSGSTVSDASGNGNDLTLINGPVWAGRIEPVPELMVSTGGVTGIETSSVTLHGSVNPFGFNTTVRFLYGTTSGVYTDSIDAVDSPVSGDSATAVSALVTGLSGGTSYYYVVAATNGYTYELGSEAAFVAGPIAWRKAMRLVNGNVQHAKAGGVVTTVTDNFTIEAWVKWDGTNPLSSSQLIAANGHANADGYGLYLYPDTKLAILISTKAWLVSDSTLTPGEWTHVAMVRNSGTWSLYKNGISLSLGGDTPTDPNTPSTNFFVGGDSVQYYFNGDIDEVRVSTAARYTSNFVVNRWPFTSDANTAALYHFDEGSGLASSDSSGNARDLTLTGSPNNPTWVDSDNPFVPMTVITNAASGVGILQATVSGSIDPHGYGATVRFLYGTTSGVYTDSVDAVPGTVSTPATVSALLTNLVGNTSYYYVIAGSSPVYYARGGEMTFSTASAVWGNDLRFNSTDASYAKAGGIVTTQTDNVTLEAWVKWDGTSTGTYQTIVSNGYSGVAEGFGLFLYTNDHAAILVPAVGWYVSANPLPSGLWVHLAAQRNNGVWSLYQSGQIQSIGSPSGNPVAPGSNTFIGGDSVGHSFNGEIDEVRISTIARYSANVVTNFGPFVADANTAALYHFSEGNGSTTGDSSGHGNDLTLFNAAAWIGSDNPQLPVRTVVTNEATAVGSWTATLNGWVNPNGDASAVRFLYGTTSGVYTDSVTAVPDSVFGNYATPMTAAVSGLANGAVYYYVAAAESDSWYDRGTEQSFRTYSPVWGSALSFTVGASQYGKAGGVVTTATDDFTIEAWVKWDGINTSSTQLIASNGQSGADGYGLYLFSDTKLAILISAKAWLQSDSTLTPGEWTHVAMVRNSGTWSLYKNGTSLTLGGTPTDPNTPSTNFFVGGDSVGSYFNGDIDEVHVSSVARYSSDFTVSTEPFGADPSTAALYHFNEGSGTTASDFSGNGNGLTLLNGPAWIINDNSNATQIYSTPGNALSFPGSGSNYVEVPYSPLLNPSDNFTVEFWARAEGGENTYRCPLGSEESSPSPQGYYFYAADNNTWQVWIGNGTWNAIGSSVPVSLNVWTHLALTFSSDTARFYVNGHLTNTVVDNSFQANTVAPFRVGDLGETPGVVPWNGKVDEVRVWSVARSAQQIREMMHRILPESSPGLVAYFQLNEGSGTSTKDLHGGFTGSITGSPSWVSSSVPVGIGTSTSVSSFTSGTANFGTLSMTTTEAFDSAVDLVVAAIDIGSNATTGIGGTVLDDRYWVINAFGTPGTFAVNLTFTVPSSFTYSGAASAPLYTLYHRSGGADAAWSALVSGASSLTGTSITFEGITTFSQFAIGTTDPLPVQMLALTATLGENGVSLQWQTVTEVDNAGWEVERREIRDQKSEVRGQKSEVRSQWSVVGFVPGTGTSTSMKEYSFADNPPYSRTAYRLKQIDRSGGFTYSEAVEVFFIPTEYALYQNYPNPFNPATTIRYDLKQRSTVTLEIYDLLGRRVLHEQKGLLEAGRYNEAVSLGQFATGVYVYRIAALGINGEQYSAIKKMMLVK